MKIYMVVEAHHGNVFAPSTEAYATAHTTRTDALNALRELADDRIYDAFAGEEGRDALADDAISDTFGDYKPCEITDAEMDFGWHWEGCGHAYVWRIITEEV